MPPTNLTTKQFRKRLLLRLHSLPSQRISPASQSCIAGDLLRALRRIDDRCGPAIPAGDDFVHYDFTLTNLLSDDASITGVIAHMYPPVLAGDRAFDLATLLFYLYDHNDIRDVLRARLLDLACLYAARAYLVHMVLRQVDWSLRFHPTAAAARRHLNLARLITADIDHGPTD